MKQQAIWMKCMTRQLETIISGEIKRTTKENSSDQTQLYGRNRDWERNEDESNETSDMVNYNAICEAIEGFFNTPKERRDEFVGFPLQHY